MVWFPDKGFKSAEALESDRMNLNTRDIDDMHIVLLIMSFLRLRIECRT